jgi:hypothetical protein
MWGLLRSNFCFAIELITPSDYHNTALRNRVGKYGAHNET